ncbi:MAG: sigma-E factor negative regulatory protein [Pseudomonadales bacterium]
MSDFNAESLSALMDSEAEELEVRRLLTQVESDSEIRARWCRYHTARSALQEEQFHYAHIDISARVREQIQNELPHSADSELAANMHAGRATFNFKPLAGLAVAASVTAVVFFGVQGLNDSADTGPGPVAHNAQLPRVEKGILPLPDTQQGEQAQVAKVNSEAAERLRTRRMQTYMQLHAQHASVNSSQRVLPLARVANHEVE